MPERRFPPPVRKIETKGRVFLAAPRTRAVTALPQPSPPYSRWQGRHHATMPEPRRFPPPWTAEETDACFIVRDANGQAPAYGASSRRRPGQASGGEAAHPDVAFAYATPS
jgi:hypothetical protein